MQPGIFFGFLLIFTAPLFQTSSDRRDPLEYIQILESADRIKKLQVDRVVDNLALKPGQDVADLGAGSGLFTRLIARQISPGGVVYAVDIDARLLAHIEETALEQDLDNIETVAAGEYDPRIPEKVDLVLICDTLHQILSPADYLDDLGRYVKFGGRVAIIDYDKDWPARYEVAPFDATQVDTWMQSAGYRKVESYDFIEGNFFHIYEFRPTGGQR